MRFANTAEGYGLLSRVLHWGIALAILGMLVLGTWIDRMTPDLSNFWLFGLHKSIGLTILVLVLVRLAWHRYSPPPVLRAMQHQWELCLARTVHGSLYLLLLAIPLTGWAASSTSARSSVSAGRWPRATRSRSA